MIDDNQRPQPDWIDNLPHCAHGKSCRGHINGRSGDYCRMDGHSVEKFCNPAVAKMAEQNAEMAAKLKAYEDEKSKATGREMQSPPSIDDCDYILQIALKSPHQEALVPALVAIAGYIRLHLVKL